jgi:hypothetical protein
MDKEFFLKLNTDPWLKLDTGLTFIFYAGFAPKLEAMIAPVDYLFC